MNPFKYLKDKFEQFIGSWAYFIGSVMADGFEDRMQAIAEEAEAEMQKQEAEETGISFGEKSKVSKGMN